MLTSPDIMATRLHRMVTDSQIRQRHAAAIQNLDVGAKTTKTRAPGSAGGTASVGRAMPK